MPEKVHTKSDSAVVITSKEKPERKKSYVVAIVIKGRRKMLMERKAIEWQDIKATKMIGSEHKRNGRASIYMAFLCDPAGDVVAEIGPFEPDDERSEGLEFPDERQAGI